MTTYSPRVLASAFDAKAYKAQDSTTVFTSDLTLNSFLPSKTIAVAFSIFHLLSTLLITQQSTANVSHRFGE